MIYRIEFPNLGPIDRKKPGWDAQFDKALRSYVKNLEGYTFDTLHNVLWLQLDGELRLTEQQKTKLSAFGVVVELHSTLKGAER